MAITARRNPQDATRRNVRAAAKRITALKKRVRRLEQIAGGLSKRVWKLERAR